MHNIVLIWIALSAISVSAQPISDQPEIKNYLNVQNKKQKSVSQESLLSSFSTKFELPEIVTWTIPSNASTLAHVNDGTIRPLIRANAGGWCTSSPTACCNLGCECYQRTPLSVVNKIFNLYNQNPSLYGPSPTIMLQELGMGEGDPCPPVVGGPAQHWQYNHALFLNWCDQIKPVEANPCSPPTSESAKWLSPWNDQGIATLKAWMTSFLNYYQVRVANGDLPVPKRFSFDTEYWPMVTWWDEKSITAFRDLAGLNLGEEPDPRWDTVNLPVYNKTLKQLYDEQIALGMTPPIPGDWTDDENHSWTVWYEGVQTTLCDAAMKEAFFDTIKEVWPEVICENFDTSISTDGLQGIPGSPTRLFRKRRHASADWYKLAMHGSSDVQAPEMYPVSELHLQLGEEPGLAWARVHRANIEACTESYDGYQLDEITPWIPLVGVSFTTGMNGEIEVPTKWSVRNLVAMFRSKGVKKFFVWQQGSDAAWLSQKWKEFDDLIGQVWNSKLSHYNISFGLGENNATEKIVTSDWNWRQEYLDYVLRIEAVEANSEKVVQCELTFETAFDCSQTREMELMIDARLEGDLINLNSEAELEVSFQNTLSGDWITLQNDAVDLLWFDTNQDKWVWNQVEEHFNIPIDQRRVVLHVPIKLSRYWINESGLVNVRISTRSSEPFALLLDSALLFETDERATSANCLADCWPEGGNGIVDLQDLLAVISAWNETNSSADVYPACGDGKVNVLDIIEVVQSWGNSCN